MPVSPSLTSVKPAPAVLEFEDLDGRPKQYTFPTLSLEELRLLQDWINDNAIGPFRKLAGQLDGLPEALAAKIVERTMPDQAAWTPPRIGEPEADRLLASSGGVAQVVTLMLRRGHPGIADDEIAHVIGQITSTAQVELIMRKSTGLSEAIPPKAGAAPEGAAAATSTPTTGPGSSGS
jgi:hypothetical protein